MDCVRRSGHPATHRTNQRPAIREPLDQCLLEGGCSLLGRGPVSRAGRLCRIASPQPKPGLDRRIPWVQFGGRKGPGRPGIAISPEVVVGEPEIEPPVAWNGEAAADAAAPNPEKGGPRNRTVRAIDVVDKCSRAAVPGVALGLDRLPEPSEHVVRSSHQRP